QSTPNAASNMNTTNNPNSTTTTSTNNPTTSTSTANPNTTATTTAPAASTTPAPANQPTQIPSTSLKDSGKSRRPRDVRLIHMLLASLGVTAYQERVPLQLLDFAYRYTSSVLQDAVHLATEGYAGATTDTGAAARGPPEVNSVSLPALRLSIASRLHYQFQSGLPKEFLMDVAAERNRVALPGASRGFDQQGNSKVVAGSQGSVLMGGLRLPPERFCLTGNGWNLR
ncbi:TFIID-31kDa-domain-containing protein, partial [Aspergillus japonicus CBS 114.51]